MGSFELERCDTCEILSQETLDKICVNSPLPPPQKIFVKSSMIGENLKFREEGNSTSLYKKFHSKAIGQLIVRDESAQWLHGSEARRQSATDVADLMFHS